MSGLIEQGCGRRTTMSEVLDTTPEIAQMQQEAFARMSGFERLEVASMMHQRILKLVKMKSSDPHFLLDHFFGSVLSADVLREVHDAISRRESAKAN